jgi:hypothetical protein
MARGMFYNTMDLAQYIPKVLRKDHDIQLLYGLVCPHVSNLGWTLDRQFLFVEEMVKNQRYRNGEEEEYQTRHFRAEEMLDIRFFDRHYQDGKYLGTKARLFFTAQSFTKKGGQGNNMENQHIDTDFLCLNSRSRTVFYQQALARSVAYDAMSALGAPAIIEKVTKNKNEGRWAIDFTRKADGKPYPNHVLDPAIQRVATREVPMIQLSDSDKKFIVAALLNNTGPIAGAVKTIAGHFQLGDDFVAHVMNESMNQNHNYSRATDGDTTGVSLLVLMWCLSSWLWNRHNATQQQQQNQGANQGSQGV